MSGKGFTDGAALLRSLFGMTQLADHFIARAAERGAATQATPGLKPGVAFSRDCKRSALRIQRVPTYRACMVDPYRDHLRARREQDPGVGATALLAEIRAMGYNGSHNLLVRYLNQGRHGRRRVRPARRADGQPRHSARRQTS